MHKDRLTAVKYALSYAWKTYETFCLDNGVWVARETRDAPSEVAHNWARNKDGVVHTGSRHGCPLVVLAVDPNKNGLSFPPNFIVEPIRDGLFDPLGPKQAAPAPDVPSTPKGEVKPKANASPKGAVALVHTICSELHKTGNFVPAEAKRLAVEKGINKSTAATQIYRWKKANNIK